MFQIDSPHAVQARPPNHPVGSPGWFGRGNPSASPPVVPTEMWEDWYNMLQAELLAVLGAVDLVQDKGDETQLLQAIRLLIPPFPAAHVTGAQLCLNTSSTVLWKCPATVVGVNCKLIGLGGPGSAGTLSNPGQGGGGGGYVEGYVATVPGETYSFVLASPGASVSTAFGFSAGTGGTATANAPGAGGTASGGTVNRPGGGGGYGSVAGTTAYGGGGGASYGGYGPNPSVNSPGPPTAGQGGSTGQGGTGGPNGPGGAGGAPDLVLEW